MGKEKVPGNARFLFVSNHLARFDPMIESAVSEKTPMAFISKPSTVRRSSPDFSADRLLTATKAKAHIVVGTIWGTVKIHRNFPWHHADIYFYIIDVIYSEKQRTAILADRIKNEMETQINERKKVLW